MTPGKVTSWVGSATDIHDLKRAEAALRESDERFQLLVEGTPDYAMFLLKPDNNHHLLERRRGESFWLERSGSRRPNRRINFLPRKTGPGETAQIEKENADRARSRDAHRIAAGICARMGAGFWVDGVMRRIDRE